MKNTYRSLIVFDIDGTLTDTAVLHGQFLAKLLLENGISDFDQNWKNYLHHTDSFILKDVYEKQNNIEFTAEILQKYDQGLRDCYSQNLPPGSLKEIPEARLLIQELTRRNQPFCYATGSLPSSALWKLQQCSLPWQEDLLLTSADDDETRHGIVEKAILSARSYYQVREFTKVISVGDGPWDYHTAKALGLEFIGVWHHEPADIPFAGSPTLYPGKGEGLLRLLQWI